MKILRYDITLTKIHLMQSKEKDLAISHNFNLLCLMIPFGFGKFKSNKTSYM